MTWTKEDVLEELVFACKVDDALPERVKPRAYGSSMPAMIRTQEDWRQAGATAFAVERDRRNAKIEKLAAVTSRQISDAEAAFGWVIDFVTDEERRHCLLEYAKAKALGWDWSRALTNRNRRNPTKSAWSRRTTYRWVWAACQAIADELDKAGVPLPEWRDLQVTHEEAETPSNLIRSGSSAWMAPDAVPRNLPGHPDRANLRRPSEKSGRESVRRPVSPG